MSDIKIIAEIGWNHMGDMNLASKMINSASLNGADICKFQTWSEKNLKKGSWDTDGRREIYKKAQLSKEDHKFLIDECEKNNIEFLTSIFDFESIDFLKNLGVKKIKIPSHEIYNVKLIEHACKNFQQIIISTGASNWEEIMNLKKIISINKVIFLHCVASYPCDAEKINFPKMAKLKQEFGHFGYSGHFQGIDDALAAIALGASIVEKHFTIDNNLPGRDNKFAMNPEDLKKISIFRDNFYKMNKNLGLNLQDCEKDIYNNYRGRWSKND